MHTADFYAAELLKELRKAGYAGPAYYGGRAAAAYLPVSPHRRSRPAPHSATTTTTPHTTAPHTTAEEAPAMKLDHRRHAVVIGGSMAGLAAARVLADHFDQVTVLDRDDLPDTAATRKGVPQGRHAHGLPARGRVAVRGQSSLEVFDQGLPALYILAHPQHGTECRQVVRQLAIGAGIHIIDE